jgi:CheY-like chemotaxis protein
MSNPDTVNILLIEDDLGHARLIEKNLRRANLTNRIIMIHDGQQALDFLFSTGEFADTPHYSSLLILLDLNLAVVDGYEVLKRLKADERTKRILVIILTTTDDTREVNRCYQLGCNIYMTKPVEYDQFSEAIRKLGLFLSVVTVPDGE